MFGWGDVHFGGHIVAVGVCSEPVVAHLLVRDNFVYRNSVLSDDGQQIIDGTVDLVIGEWSQAGVAVKLDADSELVAPSLAAKHRVAGVVCDFIGHREDISGAVAVNQCVTADTSAWITQAAQRILDSPGGSVMQHHTLHEVLARRDVGCGVIDDPVIALFLPFATFWGAALCPQQRSNGSERDQHGANGCNGDFSLCHSYLVEFLLLSHNSPTAR